MSRQDSVAVSDSYLPRLKLALDHQAAGDHEAALGSLAPIIESLRRYAPVMLAAGVSHEKLGRSEDAESAFRLALSLDHEYTPAQRALGLLLYEEERWEDALPSLEAYLADYPEDLTPLWAYSKALEALEDRFQDVDLFRRAWRATRDPAVGSYLAMLLAFEGLDEEDESIIREILAASPDPSIQAQFICGLAFESRYADAERELDSALGEWPEHMQLGVLASMVYLARGRVDEALSIARASRDEESSSEGQGAELWWITLGLAGLFRDGPTHSLRPALERLREAFPENLEVATRLAFVAIGEGRLAEAEEILRTMVDRQDDRGAFSLSELGYLRLVRGDLKEAEEILQKALAKVRSSSTWSAVLHVAAWKNGAVVPGPKLPRRTRDLKGAIEANLRVARKAIAHREASVQSTAQR